MDAFNHETVVKNHVVEAYVMGDLNEAERGAFERHIAGCGVCTLEAQYASGLVMSLREALQENLSSVVGEQQTSLCRKFLRRVLHRRM